MGCPSGEIQLAEPWADFPPMPDSCCEIPLVVSKAHEYEPSPAFGD